MNEHDDINKRLNSMLWSTIKANWWIILIQIISITVFLVCVSLAVTKGYQAIKRDFGNRPETTSEASK